MSSGLAPSLTQAMLLHPLRIVSNKIPYWQLANIGVILEFFVHSITHDIFESSLHLKSQFCLVTTRHPHPRPSHIQETPNHSFRSSSVPHITNHPFTRSAGERWSQLEADDRPRPQGQVNGEGDTVRGSPRWA